MSEQGLETLDSAFQKAHEWINSIAETSHLEKRDAYKSLRAVLITLRDRLPVDEAAHFGAQLPLLLRGIYYEGWKPSATPIKMSHDEFLKAVGEKIVADRFIDPVRMTHDVLGVLNTYLSPGELEKIRQILPEELRSLWPA